MTHELRRPPTIKEMAKATSVSEDRVLEALEAGQGYRTSSIDAPDGQENTVGSHLGEVDPGFTGTEDRLLLAFSLAKLADRERTILKLRFVDGLTQSQIASQIGVSQMQVSRLLAASLAQLRDVFSKEM